MLKAASQDSPESSEETTTGLTLSYLEDLGISETQRIPYPDWQRQGSCWRIGYDLFFPDSKDDARGKIPKAKKICAECPVKQRCLLYALQTESHHGVWGGTTRSERKKIADQLKEQGIEAEEWISRERRD